MSYKRTVKRWLRTIVFSTRSDAFLGIERALQFCVLGIGINGSEENWFVLRNS